MSRFVGKADNVPYVGFEGPIGAGKTTLATILAEYTGWELLLEDVQGNEFLADFYTDRTRWALPMQLAFLVTRHEQLVAAVPGYGPAGHRLGVDVHRRDSHGRPRLVAPKMVHDQTDHEHRSQRQHQRDHDDDHEDP